MPDSRGIEWHDSGPGESAADESTTPRWRCARITPAVVVSLMESLARAGMAWRFLPTDRLLAAWEGTVEEMLRPTPGSGVEALRQTMAELCRLSPAGLDAGLETVLEGVRGEVATALFEQVERAQKERLPNPGGERPPAVVVLSSNLPGLAAQSLLPALALRRPVLLKSPSAEPLFAPAFVDALCRREPALRLGLASVTWQGGRRDLEAPVLERAGRVVAYGRGPTMDDLRLRAGSALVAMGPRFSLAAVAEGEAAEPSTVEGLARDVALFDQRGCLSVQAAYVEGGEQEARELAGALCVRLAELERDLPPGPATVEELSGVRQMLDAAVMRGEETFSAVPGRLAAGGVVLAPEPTLEPSPGCRWVRLYPLRSLDLLAERLAEWEGRLQGVAISRQSLAEHPHLGPALRQLGVSHLAPAGELQRPDVATWENGGIAPLELFA
ncbi:MAG: hypothetical protein MI919_30035 [Holophagales bacterium]|nr:hypothetical protein [Holophagales bacterium]